MSRTISGCDGSQIPSRLQGRRRMRSRRRTASSDAGDDRWSVDGTLVLSVFFSPSLLLFSLACNDTVTQTRKHLYGTQTKGNPHDAADFGGKMRLRMRRDGCRRGCVMPPRETGRRSITLSRTVGSPCRVGVGGQRVGQNWAQCQHAWQYFVQYGTGPLLLSLSRSDRSAADSPRNTERRERVG